MTVTAPPSVPAVWRRRFEALPGYDPIASAGDCWFDADEAERWVAYFETRCVHIKGEWAGQPLVLNGWETGFVGCLFGWKRLDGTRRYRTAFVAIARKGGKSTLGAALGSGLLYFDGEPGAEIYSAAGDREQAGIIFGIAKAMVEADPDLKAASEIFVKSITAGTSFWRVLSADAPTKHGMNPHGILFDELHVQPNRDLWDVLTTGTAARRQPLTIAITTAGTDKESICWELWQYAERVRDGTVDDPAFLPVIFAADPKADWMDPETWKQANPTYPDAPKHEYLAAKCKHAQETPGFENTFRRLHLNQWTESATRWLGSEEWALNEGENPVPDGALCYGGLDLASTDDLAAFVAVFPVHGVYHVLAKHWIPSENIAKRVRRHRVPYDVWLRHGWITATDGNVIDYDVIRADLNAFAERYHLEEVAFDPWNAVDLCNNLQGKDGFTMVEIRQNFPMMSGPTKETGKVVKAGKLRTGGNPVLRWQAGNVTVRTDDNENIKPDKKRAREKIDGIVALIMAVGRAALAMKQPGSVYTKRGIRFL